MHNCFSASKYGETKVSIKYQFLFVRAVDLIGIWLG